jgi:hypothetical protein
MFDGPIRFSRHFSPTVGRLTNLNDERMYSTWKLTLRCVPRFFGDRTQHWNTEYAAAKRIFSDSGAFAVRSAIQAGHKMLYARSTKNGFGIINDARDTLKILHSGQAPGGTPTGGAANRAEFAHRVKPAVYTYVIAAEDDTLRFSETGAKFFVDFASKHALHSNCAEAVRYGYPLFVLDRFSLTSSQVFWRISSTSQMWLEQFRGRNTRPPCPMGTRHRQ